MPKSIILSPSALNLFLECPKCFWLAQNKNIHRPTSAFPSLPGGIDAVLKEYFDTFRDKGELPPEIKGKVAGRLLDDKELLAEWRNSRKGIRFYDKELEAELMGALDDCLLDGDPSTGSGQDYYIPIDYKTRGWLAKDDSHSYYQNQLDTYTFLLEKNGYKSRGFAYLIFYSPQEAVGGAKILFNVEPRQVAVQPQNAYRVFRNAVEILRAPQPKSHSACKFCAWGNDFINFE